MLKIKQKRLKVELSRKDAEKLNDDLLSKYSLLIHEMKKHYLEKLKVSLERPEVFIKEKLTGKDTALLCGDLIYTEPGLILYYKVPSSGGYIEIGSIGVGDTGSFDELARFIKNSIFDSLDEPDEKWEPLRKPDASFNMLLDNARTIKPTPEEVSAAQLLADEQINKIMKTIKNEDSMFIEKLKQSGSFENNDEIIENLVEQGLISTDFALLCSQTGQQILKVHDKSALDDISKKGFKCFICGNSITDEKLTRSVSCSNFGRKMLEDNYWLPILVINALGEIGFEPDEPLVVRGESPDTSIFLNINNEVLMFYLSNRKMSLDDAHYISANIAAYKLNQVILITTNPLSLLMKSHLAKVNPECKLFFISGLDMLKEEIQNILEQDQKTLLLDIMKSISMLTPVPIEEIVLKKVIPEGEAKHTTGFDDVLFSEITPDETISGKSTGKE